MKPWKNSASTIILIKNAVAEKRLPNFNILLQKRSNRVSFLPSNLVFPGGGTSENDSNTCWLDHFKSFELNSKFSEFQNSYFCPTQIFHQGNDSISRHVSLRITAIRELFEELGILICKSRNDVNSNHLPWATFLTNVDIPHWQKKVHDDPNQFFALCKELDCYPDIWSLHLWSNWLTPTKGRKFRYDTAFFVIALENKPNVFIEENEVADVTLTTAEETLTAYEKNEVEIIFPQWYELTRLKYQNDIDKLVQFAAARSPYGSELFFPIRQDIKDGVLVVLPGDELYPMNPDLISDTILCDKEETFESLYASASKTHRIEYYKNGDKMIRLKNYSPPNFHLSLIDENIPNITSTLKNKL